MKIDLEKISEHRCAYTITRNDDTTETIPLDVKTFLLHDVTHFVVEQALNYEKGFWGMLAAGYPAAALFGRDNPETEELRFIEKIVGPVQSTFAGNIPVSDFSYYIDYLNFPFPQETLERCLEQIGGIMADWRLLLPGQALRLEWRR